MKNLRNILFYIITIAGFLCLMYYIVRMGEPLEPPTAKSLTTVSSTGAFTQMKETLTHNVTHPLANLLLQIITIILTARIFGFICRKAGQPAVIGEIIAGIFLGPSFIGLFFPEFSAFLFPKSSLPNLQFISQIGLILFMFIVGMELDLKTLQKKAHEAVIISHASIIFPFALGMGLAYYIYQGFAPPDVSFLSFSLFIGISMSITAFPVLARIVQERQLTKTRLGAIVITCAAADDITAWCLLAAVIAVVKAGSVISSVYVIAMAIAYVIIMLKAVRPFLKRIGDIYSGHDALSKPVVALFLVTLIISSYVTEIIGIHALFGAFMAGVIMPQNLHFRNLFIEKVEDVSLVLLLPLFFVFTGLRTQIGLLNDTYMWQMCGIIILVAVTGKFIGSTVAARFVGQSWKDSLSIGALMNTRGLMELIVLNIGYDLGILNSTMFAMLVIMALITTFMTGPALDLINYFWRDKKPRLKMETTLLHSGYRVLFSFADPDHGRDMLRLSHSLAGSTSNSSITALHTEDTTELHQYNINEVERERFKPVKRESVKQNIPVSILFKPTLDFEKEIIETANSGEYDLLIVGMGRSIYEGSVLGRVLGITTRLINPEKLYRGLTGKEKMLSANGLDDHTNAIIGSVKTELGIFADKGLKKADEIIIMLMNESDAFLLHHVQRALHHKEVRVVMIDYHHSIKQSAVLKEKTRLMEQAAPGRIVVYTRDSLGEELFRGKDVMLISLNAWKEIIADGPLWLSQVPSLLILRQALGS